MELRHLRYFTAVVQWKGYQRSLAAAADDEPWSGFKRKCFSQLLDDPQACRMLYRVALWIGTALLLMVGLDQGELVTIPSLREGDEWTGFEAARRAISGKFGNSQPAPRYQIPIRRSA